MLDDSYFADTNIHLYNIEPQPSLKQRRCHDWLDWLWLSRSGRTSWQVINEFNANATRKIGAPVWQVRQTVRDLVAWNPLSPDLDLIERAWHWVDSAQVPWWDALILASAERLNCRYLLSEDFQSGRTYGTILVINPFDQLPPVAHETRQS